MFSRFSWRLVLKNVSKCHLKINIKYQRKIFKKTSLILHFDFNLPNALEYEYIYPFFGGLQVVQEMAVKENTSSRDEFYEFSESSHIQAIRLNTLKVITQFFQDHNKNNKILGGRKDGFKLVQNVRYDVLKQNVRFFLYRRAHIYFTA